MKESSIQAAILRYLNGLPESKFYNMHGSGWQGAGRPDLIGCYRGRFVAIEVKRPGEAPTKLQEHELQLWGMTGAVTMVATSLAEVKEMIGRLDKA
jgi:Holliday junction resolvase